MSIPPLVCSTPPPPDQCEDDKDPEDFDLSYNLSQEDDDDENNDYNYGNFSFNHYQSASDNKSLEIKDLDTTKSIDTEVNKKIFTQYEHSKAIEQSSISHDQFENNDINENKLKCEDEMNIEDLDLKVDEGISSNVENSDENSISDQNTDSLKDFNIPCNSKSSILDHNIHASPYDNVIDPIVGIKDSNVDLNEENVEQSRDIQSKHEPITDNADLSHSNGNNVESPIDLYESGRQETLEEFPKNVEESSEQLEFQSNQNVLDDDFGDFDDFQFVNTKGTSTSVIDSSNPWENNDTNESDFGNFTANFEETKVHTPDSSHLESKPIPHSDQLQGQAKEGEGNLEDDDDDFGDFDDFKYSDVKTESKEIQEDLCQELPVLNLQLSDNEHQIMESITKVLTSVFVEEISAADTEFEGKLETFLSETWGHLMQTDERQPYMVNWNNSLGQKTLLKALCIDSRNILFGPKWSSQMPKYAANLSVAPLQPQKQAATLFSAPQNEAIADKVSSKPTAWSDPFTSDGQESCNTENESSTITSRPTDLDVFEAAMPTKPEKIYSSTLSVQPIRQINLPDTHIFTPTDSEIPRSKTIHYNSSPTVHLPQPAVAEINISTANPTTQNTNSLGENNKEDDNEYWDFQDFKSTSDPRSLPSIVNQSQIGQEKKIETATTVNVLPKPSIAYQTQLLQPIRVEPSIPTLNWPDPGEVKATYDDFTDFVSIPSQSTEKQDSTIITQPPESQLDRNNKSDNLNDRKGLTEEPFEEVLKRENEGYDDDFDTFQSAVSSQGGSNNFKTSTFANTAIQMPLGHPRDFDFTSTQSNCTKSDSISFATTPRPNEALTQNTGYNTNKTELTKKSSSSSSIHIQTSLLQPTPASTSAVNTKTQQTTGQILQPLSLESYSQINWPSPGIDLQDLSRFNPVETLQSLKSDLSVSGFNKVASPVHTQKNTTVNQSSDDDGWGEFVSSKPKQQQGLPKKPPVFAEDDEWTDFISSPSVTLQNGLNTISLNVHTNSNIQKTGQNKFPMKTNQTPVDIPTLNYITPKSHPHKTYNEKHFQNL